jgi:hypothetical protein
MEIAGIGSSQFGLPTSGPLFNLASLAVDPAGEFSEPGRILNRDWWIVKCGTLGRGQKKAINS